MDGDQVAGDPAGSVPAGDRCWRRVPACPPFGGLLLPAGRVVLVGVAVAPGPVQCLLAAALLDPAALRTLAFVSGPLDRRHPQV